jgi:solute carrier family 25 carnitine/acylcarnitine transporter 20/29
MATLVARSPLEQAACALAFGAASPLVGHPIDSVKTRMQADARFASTSALQTLRTILAGEGVRGLYRGLLPPLLGSSVFRSVQFGVFGAVMSAARASPLLTSELPGSAGLQLRVVVAATLATAARALIEAPLEMVKVRRQLDRRVLAIGGGGSGGGGGPERRSPASLRELAVRLYGGGSLQLTALRLWIALGGFFCLVDHVDRHHPELTQLPVVGPFVKGSVCATIPWIAAWPLEVLKTEAQAGNVPSERAGSLRSRLAWVVETKGGAVGLFRGIGPGLLRSSVANGAATLAFSTCQACFRAPAL